jgi:hypothetical protein
MVNKDCPLVLSNLYEYDFQACVYNILKNLNWDLSGIDEFDKRSRNIKIGLLRRDNPALSNYLESTIVALIDYYLILNQIDTSDIILRLKDGLVLTKPMKRLNDTMPLEFRGAISKLILSLDRRKWMKIYSNGNVVVKGVSSTLVNREMFNLFSKFDYTNKYNLVSSLEGLRRLVLKSNKDITWYLHKKGGDYIIPIVDVGYVKVDSRETCISKYSIDVVDRSYLWDEHIWEFVEPIIVDCL